MCGSYVLHSDDIVPFQPVPEVSGAVFSRALLVVTFKRLPEVKNVLFAFFTAAPRFSEVHDGTHL